MKIAITGKMRTGKDTAALFFMEKDKCLKIAFGDAIKQIAMMYFPEIVEAGKPRNLYQGIGQQFRGYDSKVWIKQLDKTIEKIKYYGRESFVVTDVRQMNEYEYLKAQGFTVIKMEAADEIRKERIAEAGDVYNEADFNHETESAVDGIPYDYLVSNNGTHSELIEQLEFIRNDLKG